VWAFGAVLYEVYTGRALFHADKNGDIEQMDHVFMWTTGKLDNKLKQVACASIRDLLRGLLHPDKGKRLQTMDQVLSHSFFDPMSAQSELQVACAQQLVQGMHKIQSTQQALECQLAQATDGLKAVQGSVEVLKRDAEEIKAQNDSLHGKADALVASTEHVIAQNDQLIAQNEELMAAVQETLQQVRLSEAVLRKTVMQATEVQCPRCFIILHCRLQAGDSCHGDTDKVVKYAEVRADFDAREHELVHAQRADIVFVM
jgi:chromosome segregation ATPase